MRRLTGQRVLLTLGITFGAFPTPNEFASAQTQPRVVRIPDAPTCPNCTITLQPIATLGGKDGPGEIDRPLIAIREDARGRFWFLSGENDMPRVYGSNGTFLGTIGRYGAGPGEFLGAAAIMRLPGDSMLIIDGRGARATVVGSDLKPRRSFQYLQDVQPEFALDWPRSVMLQGWIPTGKTAGKKLHRASFADGKPNILQSFSPDTAWWGKRFDWLEAVRAVQGRTGYWSYSEYRYRFTQWSNDDRKTGDFERDAAWFPRKEKVNPIGNPTTPPVAHLVRVIPIDEQRVWSIVNVPSPNWKRTWERVTPGSAEIAASSIAMENLYNTIIEEIDLKSGRVLSRTKTDKWIVEGLESGKVVGYEVEANGVPKVVVYQLVRGK